MARVLGTKIVSAGAQRLVAIDYTHEMDGSEVLTGTPVITELGKVVFDSDGNMVLDSDGCPTYEDSDDLTIENEAINSSATMPIDGKYAAVNKAVQCRIRNQVKGNTYVIQISIGTTSSPAETLVDWVLVKVI